MGDGYGYNRLSLTLESTIQHRHTAAHHSPKPLILQCGPISTATHHRTLQQTRNGDLLLEPNGPALPRICHRLPRVLLYRHREFPTYRMSHKLRLWWLEPAFVGCHGGAVAL